MERERKPSEKEYTVVGEEIYEDPSKYSLKKVQIIGFVHISNFFHFSPEHQPDSEVLIDFLASLDRGVSPLAKGLEYKFIRNRNEKKNLGHGVWLHISTPLEECLAVQPSLNQWFNSDYAPKSSSNPDATVWDWLGEQENEGMSKPCGEWILLEG